MKKVFMVLAILILVAGFSLLYLERAANIRNAAAPTFSPGDESLPPQVKAKRDAIYAAALSRDYERLAALATYPNFAYTFGGPYPGGFAGFMKLSAETEGENAFDIIPRLLRLPYSYSDGIYTWPSVFHKEPQDWTAENITMMKTFLTDELIQSYREFGGYIYYRIGITDSGEWIYYIAGD